MANFYVADTHFGHKNIMRFSKRNFKNVDEMDKVLIDNWNKVVSDEDDVWILGDLVYRSAKCPQWYLKQLNGRKHLLVGNHDTHLLKQGGCKEYFESIDKIVTVEDQGYKIVLCHFPIAEWDGYFRGVLHFYGHIHNNVSSDTYKLMKTIPNAYNVGVDILRYTPRTLEQVLEYNKKFFTTY